MPTGEWPRWMETFEFFARMGIADDVKPFAKQLDHLEGLIDQGRGMFRVDYPQQGNRFRDWGSYGFGALQPDWAGDGKTYDLTFRCLLILHHAGRLEL